MTFSILAATASTFSEREVSLISSSCSLSASSSTASCFLSLFMNPMSLPKIFTAINSFPGKATRTVTAPRSQEIRAVTSEFSLSTETGNSSCLSGSSTAALALYLIGTSSTMRRITRIRARRTSNIIPSHFNIVRNTAISASLL